MDERPIRDQDPQSKKIKLFPVFLTGGWGCLLKLNTILSAALLLGSSVCFAFTEVGKIETVVNSRKIANLKLTAPIEDSIKNLFLGTKDKNCETKIL